MNLQDVQARLQSKFANVEQVAAGVLRSVRREGGKDVAVYVFDINDKIAESAAQLDPYLDKVIGRSYFDESTSPDLRWNHYLYFVAGRDSINNSALGAAIRKLEADRRYARKFVVGEDDLDAALSQIDSVIAVDDSTAAGDILQLWTSRLLEAGLDAVLALERPVTDVVRTISTVEAKQNKRTRRASGAETSRIVVSSFLSSINLTNFREFPRRQKFDRLAGANLIIGANGVGKTSLLEGIEFLYCGANRRSDAAGQRAVAATLEGGETVDTSSGQPLSDFKTRQRLWFGSDDVSRRNTLPNQFARFNFLNTDAAAELSLAGTGDESVRENMNSLASLLSGQEATRLWTRLVAVHRAIIEEIKSIEADRRARIAELRAAEAERKTLSATPKQSDADYAILRKDLSRLGWREPIGDKASVTPQLVEQVSEVASRLGTVDLLSWATQSVTPAWLSDQQSILAASVNGLRRLVDAGRSGQERRNKLLSRRRSLEKRLAELESIPLEGAMDLVIQTDRLAQLEREIATATKAVAAISPEHVLDFAAELHSRTVADAVATGRERLAAVRARKEAAEQLLASLRSRQSYLQSVAVQLHDLARSAITHGHSDQHCPVCGTHFDEGVLLQRIDNIVIGPDEAESSEAAVALEDLAKAEAAQSDLCSRLDRVMRFCEASALVPSRTMLSDALLHARRVQQEHASRVADRGARLEIVASYEKTGLTIERLREVCRSDGASNVSDDVSVDVSSALKRIRDDQSEATAALTQMDRDEATRKSEAARALEAAGLPGDTAIESGYETVLSHLNAVSLVIDACDAAGTLMRVSLDSDIRAHQSAAHAAVRTAATVLAGVERERETGAREDQLARDLERLDGLVAKHAVSLDRLAKATGVLDDLVNNHSLEKATKDAIGATHAVADGIFRRIHSPSEYVITTDASTPLARRVDGRPVSLREVSTGQRAAYALSTFLAMNAQVREGPKVVILDDPIAHVDDLNALSFLDYLRDLVLHSKRQLFFATADEKIAGLFSHKFAFLGDKFRTIELIR